MARDLKTTNSRRVLPLMAIVRAALIEHAAKNCTIIPSFNPCLELSTNDTIVMSENGKLLEPRNLARCFHRLTKKARLPRIKLHAVRHGSGKGVLKIHKNLSTILRLIKRLTVLYNISHDLEKRLDLRTNLAKLSRIELFELSMRCV